MENKSKITTGPNERARNETIGQTGGGIPDDTSRPITDVDDAEIDRARAALTGGDQEPGEDEDALTPRFVDCEVNVWSFNPLVGILRIETDREPVEIVIDREDAGILAGTLVELLSATEADEEDEDEED